MVCMLARLYVVTQVLRGCSYTCAEHYSLAALPLMTSGAKPSKAISVSNVCCAFCCARCSAALRGFLVCCEGQLKAGCWDEDVAAGAAGLAGAGVGACRHQGQAGYSMRSSVRHCRLTSSGCFKHCILCRSP